MSESKVIVALDYDQKDKALALADQIDPASCNLKVGKEMFTYFGPEFVKELVKRDFKVFLDLKFHDIPNTVAKACKAAADLGVWMVNVHASGGEKMMSAARESLDSLGSDKPHLIAVTILTSMDNAQLQKVGVTDTLESQVDRLATLTRDCGLDGVVCSAMESSRLKQLLSKEFLTVTPGIRPAGAAKSDQVRVMTPEQAVANGVDYMVIGRPITQAENPLAVLNEINNSIRYTNPIKFKA